MEVTNMRLFCALVLSCFTVSHAKTVDVFIKHQRPEERWCNGHNNELCVEDCANAPDDYIGGQCEFGDEGFGCYCEKEVPCEEPILCRCCNDPHCVTFDGTPFDHHGTCNIILSGTLKDKKTQQLLRKKGVPQFEVYAQHRLSGTISLVNVMGLRLPEQNMEIEIFYDRVEATLNGEPIEIPKTLTPDDLLIDVGFDSAGIRQIKTSFGLTIKVTSRCEYVTLDCDLADAVDGYAFGICGQWDGTPTDEDFTIADGRSFVRQEVRRTVEQPFYDEYTEPEKPPGCRRLSPPNIDDPNAQPPTEDECPAKTLAKAKEICAAINDKTGPFGVCHGTVNERNTHYLNCLFDVCHETPKEKFVCAALENYAIECAKHGDIGDWRKTLYNKKCRMKCPPNARYVLKFHADCLPTCDNPEPCKDGLPAKGPFEESCTCRKNFVWNGKRCVHKRLCRKAKIGRINARRCWRKCGNRERAKCLVDLLKNKEDCKGLEPKKRIKCAKKLAGGVFIKDKPPKGNCRGRNNKN